MFDAEQFANRFIEFMDSDYFTMCCNTTGVKRKLLNVTKEIIRSSKLMLDTGLIEQHDEISDVLSEDDDSSMDDTKITLTQLQSLRAEVRGVLQQFYCILPYRIKKSFAAELIVASHMPAPLARQLY